KYTATSIAKPAASGCLMWGVNGQPPHMIAAQNITGTQTIVQCAMIGPGGVTPAPMSGISAAPISTPITPQKSVSSTPFIGCDALPANAGCAVPQVTIITICSGMVQS